MRAVLDPDSNAGARIERGKGGRPWTEVAPVLWSAPADAYGSVQRITTVWLSGAVTSWIRFMGGVAATPTSGMAKTVQANTKSSAVRGVPSCQTRFGRNR